jgi:hypothetical protein
MMLPIEILLAAASLGLFVLTVATLFIPLATPGGGRVVRLPGLRGVALVSLAVALSIAVATQGLVGYSNALFTASQSDGATFSTAKCFEPSGTRTQRGSFTSTTSGTTSVPIASVDPARSFLLLSMRSSSNRPVGSTIRGRIASPTTLELARVTNEASPAAVVVEWSVVTYNCGVRVQRGEVAQSATTVNVPLQPLASTSRAFVLFSKTVASGDQEWDSDDAVLADLTSTTNLQLRTNSANAAHTVAWQVVEFDASTDIAVQRGTTSLLGASLSTTITLASAVNLARTFALVSFRTSGGGPDIGARLLRARLTSTTQLVIDRSMAGSPDDITEIAWQVVELKDGSVVQQGSAAFASGLASQVIPITTVDLTRAATFATVQGGPGQSMGSALFQGLTATETYATATAGTSWVVPAGVTQVTIKAWGSGGGAGGGGSQTAGGAGGGGGYATATISVTPGETLILRVGGGGAGGGYNNAGGAPVGVGGGGGGYTGVFRSVTPLLVAAGGGGGGGGNDESGSALGGAGGVAGGTTGGTGVGGSGSVTGGSGGTQVAGGATGGGNSVNTVPGTDGASLLGGNGGTPAGTLDGPAAAAGGTNGGGQGGRSKSGGSGVVGRAGGGGGGAGYYGGGGGTAANNAGTAGAGGGGGSSYVTGTGTGTASGSGRNAGNNVDASYGGSAGQGGLAGAVATAGAAGIAGRLVVSYTTAPDDIPGIGSFSGTLTASSVTLQRGSTGASADVGWVVVEWGGPLLTQAFSPATSGTSWVVPAGVSLVVVKAWGGGGGGGGGGSSRAGGAGGGGGFASSTLVVTPGETLTIRVGGGGGAGAYASATSYPVGTGGGGGGYSGIFRSGSALVIAAGGGGGGGGDNNSGATGGAGGPGGGSAGASGAGGGPTVGGGGGGTQVAGGPGGSGTTSQTTAAGAGSSLAGGTGGSANPVSSSPAASAGGLNGGGAGGRVNAGSASLDGRAGGGGGGSGYFGGGGGTAANAGSTSGGGGGGGSSFTTGSATTTASGSGQTAGSTGDPSYAGTAGRGGNAGGVNANGASGSAGRIVLNYVVLTGSIDGLLASGEAAPGEPDQDRRESSPGLPASAIARTTSAARRRDLPATA